MRCAALITATGNNLIIKGDLTRRSVVCRLDPKVERPELRQFTYDPIADAKDHRAELVAAAITILRAYHVAGRPNRPPRLQSFEIWSDTVRGALMWLGAGDPAGTMDRLRKADPVLASLTAVLLDVARAFGSEPTTAREAIEATDFGLSWTATEARRKELRDALMAVAGRGGKIDSRVLGNWLAHKPPTASSIYRRFGRTRRDGGLWTPAGGRCVASGGEAVSGGFRGFRGSVSFARARDAGDSISERQKVTHVTNGAPNPQRGLHGGMVGRIGHLGGESGGGTHWSGGGTMTESDADLDRRVRSILSVVDEAWKS